MAAIVYRQGDATLPPERPALICHVVNDLGKWGRGFTAALDARFGSGPRYHYLRWMQGRPDLGSIALYTVEPDLRIAHLLAQHGVGRSRQRLSYPALDLCLRALQDSRGSASIHMPRIGTGLGGGVWPEIEPLIYWRLADSVYVYDGVLA